MFLSSVPNIRQLAQYLVVVLPVVYLMTTSPRSSFSIWLAGVSLGFCAKPAIVSRLHSANAIVRLIVLVMILSLFDDDLLAISNIDALLRRVLNRHTAQRVVLAAVLGISIDGVNACRLIGNTQDTGSL